MKLLKYIVPFILIFAFAFAASASEMPVEMPLRGVWVATVYQIDYPAEYSTSSEKLKEWANEILDNAENMGFNTVFLQVRPTADAFYKSSYFPWSKYISGSQGVAPDDGFDPLEYWVSEAHKRNIDLHAWINPYRVAVSESDFNSLSDMHPAKINPKWVVQHTNGQYYFNPGIPEVRELIKNGVREIVEKYNIDGVHLDDYFYPSQEFADADAFKKYGANFDNIDDWRRDNIDVLISDLHMIAMSSGKKFGVSPAGIWANKASNPNGSDTAGNQTYFNSYADTRKWVKKEWIDYIVPQIYWNIGYDIADYEVLVKWWADVVQDTNVELYIGMADYRAELEDATSVWYGNDELRRQLELNREIPQITGEVHYNYSSIAENPNLCKLYSEVYAGKEPEQESAKWLIHDAYLTGSSDKFMPDGELTRAQAATLFARITSKLGYEAFNENKEYKTEFSDIDESEWYANAVGFVQKLGIVSGYPDGSFKPEKTITRAEFATIISRVGEMKESAKTFPDVPAEHWACKYVQNAYAKGLISGYPDGSFAPNKTITRAETTKIINRLLDRVPHKLAIDTHSEFNIFTDVSSSHWAYYEIVEASAKHEYMQLGDAEYWNTGDNEIIGENGFIYASDKFKFEVPELRKTAELTPLNLSKVDSIALHHMEHPTATFRDIERWHIEGNEWRAIGYNFWVGFDGKIYVGRGLNVGAGVANNNSHIISIGFQGAYHKTGNKMPQAQYNAGLQIIEWLKLRVNTITTIGGHGSWNATDCPGDSFPLTEMATASGLKFLPLLN